jgi:NAD(P)-dependent dehydrogenase (short-subunit alcohol dehydrogenase family)
MLKYWKDVIFLPKNRGGLLMGERTVIITGANSGIGKAATIKFATEGCRVIMACRDVDRSKKAQMEIMAATKSERVELMELDVSSFESIRKFCDEFKTKYETLDILIHNAAYFNHGEKSYQFSRDQIELTFATNTFGPYLLTKLLADHLAKSEDPRILNACTTNIRYFFDPKRKIEFDNLQGEFKDSKPYSVYVNYGNSKMALLMLTFKMAEHYHEQGIKVNAVQIPVIKVSKETIKKVSPGYRIIARLQNLLGDSQESMANTYFHLCTSEEFKNVTGRLVNDKRKIVNSSHYGSGIKDVVKQFFDKDVYPTYADNREIIEKVWELSARLTEEA